MEDLPVFDRAGVVNRVESDMDLLRELVEIFLSEYEEHLETIRYSIHEKDAYRLNRESHSIKSALGNLGGMRAHKAAFALENAGREDKFEETPVLFEGLKAEIQDFLEHLAAFMKENGVDIPGFQKL